MNATTPAGELSDFDKRMTAKDPLYPARRAALAALHKHIDEWFSDYEFDDGESFTHSPSELESLLIADAFHGLTADDEYRRLHLAWQALCPAADRALRQGVAGMPELPAAVKLCEPAWGYTASHMEAYAQAALAAEIAALKAERGALQALRAALVAGVEPATLHATKLATLPAAAPVVLPEPDAAIKEVLGLVDLFATQYMNVSYLMDQPEHETDPHDVQLAYKRKAGTRQYIESKLRALLAAAPQPAPERKPLTDAEITSLYFEALGAQRIQDTSLITRIVRAVERRHGITGKPG